VVLRSLLALTLLTVLAVSAAVGQQANLDTTKSGVKASRVTRVRGNVLAVEDADRVKVATDDGVIQSLVLLGVDAPDVKQDLYKKAKKRLEELVKDKDVTVIIRTNGNDENVAVVYAGSDDVGLKLIQEGLAWYSVNRSREQPVADRDAYQKAEASAKAAGSGIWKDKNAVAPWTLRGEKTEPVMASTMIAEERPAGPKKDLLHPDRKYILGPRGGCYYLSDEGVKVYVKDKSYCQQP